MAKKQDVPDYSSFALIDESAAAQAPATRAAPAGKTLKERSKPLYVYMHPDGKRALEIHCAHVGIKVHDFAIAALEDAFKRHGIKAPVRVQSSERGAAEADPQQAPISKR